MKVWTDWVKHLQQLKEIHIPRCMLFVSYSGCNTVTLHVFSDASEQAIAACAYLRGIDADNTVHVVYHGLPDIHT